MMTEPVKSEEEIREQEMRERLGYDIPRDVLPVYSQKITSRANSGASLLRLLYNMLRRDLAESQIPRGLQYIYLLMLGMQDEKNGATSLENILQVWQKVMRGGETTISEREAVKIFREFMKTLERLFTSYDNRYPHTQDLLTDVEKSKTLQVESDIYEVFKEVGLTGNAQKGKRDKDNRPVDSVSKRQHVRERLSQDTEQDEYI